MGIRRDVFATTPGQQRGATSPSDPCPAKEKGSAMFPPPQRQPEDSPQEAESSKMTTRGLADLFVAPMSHIMLMFDTKSRHN